MFGEMQNEWTALVNRVTALESKLAALKAPVPTPTQAPVGAVAGVPGPSNGPGSLYNPAPAPVVPTQETAPVAPQPGPQAVPTLDQIRDRLMQLNEAQGPEICMSVLASHGGKDDAGNINVKLVPVEQYARLYGVLGARLGLH